MDGSSSPRWPPSLRIWCTARARKAPLSGNCHPQPPSLQVFRVSFKVISHVSASVSSFAEGGYYCTSTINSLCDKMKQSTQNNSRAAWHVVKYALCKCEFKTIFVLVLQNRSEFINLRNHMISFYFRSAFTCVLFPEVQGIILYSSGMFLRAQM